ncbi:hypothetical protein [Subtercola vilae]|uniref:Uncharacterized protein n=1 Tax=Subtercola vilae TaxID=2056433 RepID=A0A4T2BTI7_9MICO|nr:hypothetical protein [Subtercola vilae]TIH34975.1 hypothetical protein D4765_11825 [Subtercola vilae]
MATKTVSKNDIKLTTAIPGGMASWWRRDDLPPLADRLLNASMLPLNPVIQALRKDPNFAIDFETANQLLELNDVGVVVFLKSWTRKDGEGNSEPIPASTKDVLMLDRKLYDALIGHAAKLMAESAKEDPFSIDAIEDPESPTQA